MAHDEGGPRAPRRHRRAARRHRHWPRHAPPQGSPRAHHGQPRPGARAQDLQLRHPAWHGRVQPPPPGAAAGPRAAPPAHPERRRDPQPLAWPRIRAAGARWCHAEAAHGARAWGSAGHVLGARRLRSGAWSWTIPAEEAKNGLSHPRAAVAAGGADRRAPRTALTACDGAPSTRRSAPPGRSARDAGVQSRRASQCWPRRLGVAPSHFGALLASVVQPPLYWLRRL